MTILNTLSICIRTNWTIFFCSDEYWQNHPELHDVPIYYASQLAKKCMSGTALYKFNQQKMFHAVTVASKIEG